MDRVGVVAANMSGLTFPELQGLAKEAEAGNFDAIFSPEFMNDSLMNCQIMAQATSKRILRGGFDQGVILEWVDDE